MRQDDWSQLNDMVIAAADEVLTAAGIRTSFEASVAHGASKWAEKISIIGLGGDKLRGSLVLSVPSALLAGSHPARARGDEDLADWLSELANLLLGQLKARLLARGITIEMSTPITLSGMALRFYRFKGLPVTYRFVTAQDEMVHVMFEAVGDDNAQFAQERDESVALDGGDMMLF